MRAQNLREFFPDRFKARLEAAKGIAAVFEVVVEAVQEREWVSRGGIMLGIAELGEVDNRVIGALHPTCTNFILLNRAALRKVHATDPALMNPFLFHVLMHEYLHTVGLGSEGETRKKVLEITRPLLGDDHPATKMAEDIRQYFSFIVYPSRMPMPEGIEIELVENVDLSGLSYFA
jgi:hypothetical protein